MPRVYEIARELGLSSKEVLGELERLGTPVASHASSIDEATVERLRRSVDGEVPAAEATAVSQTATEAPAEAEPEEAEEKKAPRRRGLAHTLAELPLLVLVAFGIAVLIKTFLVQAFYIPSASMYPTLRVGDRVLVEKVTYRLSDPSRGDVVVFEKSVFGVNPPDVPWYGDVRNYLRELLGLPVGTEEDYIKRVVAVGGDTIRYAGEPRRLEVNGNPVDEPYIRGGRDKTSQTLTSKDCARLDMTVAGRACRVPAGMVFVMGDNRSNSQDSRFLGPIDEDRIVGNAFVIVWPPGHLSGL